MPATTPVYTLPYPLLASDPPNGPAQIQALAEATETALGAVSVGVPSGSVSLDPSAWTELCSVTVTVSSSGIIDAVGWALFVNTGAGRPVLTLQVLDGPTHLFGVGGFIMGGTSDQFGNNWTLTTPRRRITGLTPGSHTFHLQAWKDGNGSVDCWKTRTFSSQLIAVTGIEVVA